MRVFPSLVPTDREYDFGHFPLTEEASPNAGFIRFRHGTYATRYQLRLGFSVLSEAQASLIRTHYADAAGGFTSFHLPTSVWAGQTFSANITPIGSMWCYAGPYQEEHLYNSYYNIQIELILDETSEEYIQFFTAQLVSGAATGA